VDVGEGWLIFDAPEADLGVHPTEGGEPPSGTPNISFYCDDIAVTVRELKLRGVEFTQEVEDHGYGLVTFFKAPGDLRPFINLGTQKRRWRWSCQPGNHAGLLLVPLSSAGWRADCRLSDRLADDSVGLWAMSLSIGGYRLIHSDRDVTSLPRKAQRSEPARDALVPAVTFFFWQRSGFQSAEPSPRWPS
jgi:hypothetical protein